MSDKSPLIYLRGATAIGRAIGLTPRQAYYQLERGYIRAACKKGGIWISEEGRLHREMLADIDDASTETF